MLIPFRPLLRRSLLAVLAVALLAPVWSAEPSASPARPSAPWIKDAVVYEVFPRQFSPEGNFAGVTARLEELKDLGVTVVWLMPVHPIGRLKAKGTIGSPYAVRDYYAVNPDYGTKEDLRRLVTEAHRRGLKVVIDIVANHTAWDSVMLQHPEYYKRDAEGRVIPPNPDWTDVAGLDYRNPATGRYMTDMLKYWIREFDLDGFRCDVAGEVPTDFWENARQELEAIKPGLFLLAEASKPDLLVHAFDSDYAWPMLGAMNRVLMEGAPATEIERTWRTEEQAKFPAGSRHLRFTDNHDEPRAIARFGWRAALAASIMTYSLDGLPLVYNGMEVGDTSESGDPALFEKVGIFWHPKQREHFRATYREYFAFRRDHPALTGTEVDWLENSASRDVVSFARADRLEQLVVVVNLSNRPVHVAVKTAGPEGYVQALPRTAKAAETTDLTSLSLEAFEWRIYRRPQAP